MIQIATQVLSAEITYCIPMYASQNASSLVDITCKTIIFTNMDIILKCLFVMSKHATDFFIEYE